MNIRKQQPKTPISEMPSAACRFDYRLSYDEAYEAFYLLSFKWDRRFRLFAGLGLSVIAIVLMVLFAMDNRKIHYFFIVILCVLLLFYLVYMPIVKARRGARSVARSRGTFRIVLSPEGTIGIPGQEPQELEGDKDARAIETDDIFVIRPDSASTFCLPKRIMKSTEIKDVRAILSGHIKYISMV
ncbi:hypothetical protein [Hornefia butyriciproducens]|uniref:hypothetical protein n=1 Tax=Hornefia butyriciproducens TaxID=2652293 RepID=UPI003F8B1089